MIKRVSFFILVATIAVLLGSCASSKHSSTYGGSYSNPTSAMFGDATGGSFVPDNAQRIMIYNANLTIVSRKPDTVLVKAEALAKKYGGYVLNKGTGMVTIRVKADQLELAMRELESFGKLKSKYLYAEDITEAFQDLNIRLENAEKARNRYLELLKLAATVEETLKVEKELERLNTEIDLLKGKLNRYSHLVDFSTIDVYVKQRKQPGPLGYIIKYLYKGVKFLFVIN